MNISTGGPHILLFERDQQLTALIMSEFQLAGYECHTARTAVEVFDALARYPIRIVLVDLAQAAAARREFWVALDTQRRGRGIHVLTFHCSNIAGYGPRDPDERSQNTAADLDIDGMLGIMKLVDEVRNRVPGAGSITNTIPRVPRITPTPQPTPASQTQRTGSMAPVTSNNGTSARPMSGLENMGNTAQSRSASGIYSQATVNTSTVSSSTARTGNGATNNPASTKSVSYTDKISCRSIPISATGAHKEVHPRRRKLHKNSRAQTLCRTIARQQAQTILPFCNVLPMGRQEWIIRVNQDWLSYRVWHRLTIQLHQQYSMKVAGRIISQRYSMRVVGRIISSRLIPHQSQRHALRKLPLRGSSLLSIWEP